MSNRKPFKGHCQMCGINKSEPWSELHDHATLKQQGARRKRRTRRNTIEPHEFED